MIETQEQIDFALSLAGELLEFEKGDILAIPGTIVYNISSFDSPYDIEKQDFDFQTSLKLFHEVEIGKNDTFVYTLLDKVYAFEVTSYVDDLVGWVNLRCKLVGVAE